MTLKQLIHLWVVLEDEKHKEFMANEESSRFTALMQCKRTVETALRRHGYRISQSAM